MLLSKKSEIISRHDLYKVDVPNGTDSFIPLPHHQVLDTALSCLSTTGYGVEDMQLSVAKGGDHFFGLLSLSTPIGTTEKLTVGLRNSHRKDLSLGFAVGTKTVVCSNLMFTSDIVIQARHTLSGSKNYVERMLGAIGQLTDYVSGQEERLNELKTSFVTPTEAESLILRSYEQGIIGARQVMPILEEYRKPTFDHGFNESRYSLLQCFTEVMKERFTNRPVQTTADSIKLYSFLAA